MPKKKEEVAGVTSFEEEPMIDDEIFNDDENEEEGSMAEAVKAATKRRSKAEAEEDEVVDDSQEEVEETASGFEPWVYTGEGTGWTFKDVIAEASDGFPVYLYHAASEGQRWWKLEAVEANHMYVNADSDVDSVMGAIDTGDENYFWRLVPVEVGELPTT